MFPLPEAPWMPSGLRCFFPAGDRSRPSQVRLNVLAGATREPVRRCISKGAEAATTRTRHQHSNSIRYRLPTPRPVPASFFPHPRVASYRVPQVCELSKPDKLTGSQLVLGQEVKEGNFFLAVAACNGDLVAVCPASHALCQSVPSRAVKMDKKYELEPRPLRSPAAGPA